MFFLYIVVFYFHWAMKCEEERAEEVCGTIIIVKLHPHNLIWHLTNVQVEAIGHTAGDMVLQ